MQSFDVYGASMVMWLMFLTGIHVRLATAISNPTRNLKKIHIRKVCCSTKMYNWGLPPLLRLEELLIEPGCWGDIKLW